MSALAAGSVLPLSAKPKDLDVLVARAYSHPALSTPMVRLGPGTIDEAVDLEMELLGFAAAGRDDVGRVSRQPLGFPAWALVNDKKNARFALDVLEEMKKSIRRMKSKPGAAKEGLDAIGAQLAGSVPHFLPSYYEEAARAFIEHDNLSYAQQYFEKARAAERQYGLEADEDLREQSFVDFALAGALAVKSLTNYADELTARGKDGLDAYLRVCVRRTMGGLPPSPTQLKDIGKLAKAAKIKPAEAELEFISQIASASALRRAAKGFFTKAKKALGAAASADSEVASALLDLWPMEIKAEPWLEQLDAWGLLDAIVDANAPGQSSRTAAAWMTGMLSACRTELAFGLIEKAAPRLIDDGHPLGAEDKPLSFTTVETSLRLGIPHAFVRFTNLDNYYRGQRWPSEDIPLIAGDEIARARFVGHAGRLRPRAYQSLPEPELPRFLEMLSEAVSERLAPVGTGGLVDTQSALNLLDAFPGAYASRIPALAEALSRIDVAESFASQLRFGCVEEVCFPEFEAMATSDRDVPNLFLTPPYLTMAHGHDVVVLDRDGSKVLEHTVPKSHEYAHIALYVGEDLLVFVGGRWDVSGYYWASAPGAVHPLTPKAIYGTSARAAVRLDSGDVLAGALIKAGSTTVRLSHLEGRPIVHDGAPHLLSDSGWLRYDPKSGESAPTEAPSEVIWHWRLELEPREGAPVRVENDVYAFGYQESGLIHWDASGELGAATQRLEGTLRLPARSDWCAITYGYRRRELHELNGRSRTGRSDFLSVSKRPFPPAIALPYCVPSDPDASKRLATIEAAALEGILSAARGDEAHKVSTSSYRAFEPHPSVASAVDAALPTTYDPLRTALIGAAHLAGQVSRLHAKVAQAYSGGEAAPEDNAEEAAVPSLPKRTLCDPALTDALGDWATPMGADYRRRIPGPTLVSELAELRLRFDRPLSDEHTEEYAWGHHCWQPALGHGTYVLYRMALAPKKAEEARTQLAAFAHKLVEHGFEDPAHYRMAFRRENTKEACKGPYNPTFSRLGDNRVLAWQLGFKEAAYFTFVEYAPKGEFVIVDDPTDNLYGPCWLTPERIDEVAAHVREAGPLPIKKALPFLREATGLTDAEATMWASAEIEADPFKLVKKGRKAAKTSFEHDPFVFSPGHMLHMMELVSAVWMAGDYKELWDPKVLAERLAAVYLRHHPKVPALTPGDEAVLASCAPDSPQQSIDEPSWSARLLAEDVVGDSLGELLPFLHLDREFHFDKDGLRVAGMSGSSVVTGSRGFFSSLKWDYVPVTLARVCVPPVQALYEAQGHALLVRSLPRFWKLLRDRLKGPALYQKFDHLREELAETVAAALPAGGPSTFRGDKPERLLGDDRRVFIGRRRMTLYVRYDALLEGEPLVAEQVAAKRVLRNLEFITGEQGDRLIALAEQVAGTDGCAGDPRVSAPKVVKNVAKLLSVSPDAAAYYLMLACLPSPTDKRVIAIGGWKAKDLDALGAELVAKELIIEGKRAGAGRTRFIPGLWVKDKHRVSAVKWTRDLFGWGDDTDRHAPLDSVFEGAVPPYSPDALFEAAWARIEAGEGPKFEEPGR
ncbi:MAG: hypothetical protein AB8I08_02995 [Sandaracinaceae bacterium]